MDLLRAALESVDGSTTVRWPPSSEEGRLAEYAVNDALRLGKHWEVFGSSEWGFEFDRKTAIAANYLGALTGLMATRGYGEPIAIVPEGLDAGDERDATERFFVSVRRDCGLDWLDIEAAVSRSARGDFAYKVWYSGSDRPWEGKRRRIIIEPLDTSKVFVHPYPINPKYAQSIDVCQIVPVAKDRYLWQETHELRDGEAWIVNRFYKLREITGTYETGAYEYDAKRSLLSPEQAFTMFGLAPETYVGIDTLPVVYVRGESQYDDALTSLQAEVDNRITQRAEVQDIYLPPLLAGPWMPGTGDDPGEIDISKHRVFATDGNSSHPASMLTWDATLQNIRDALVDLDTKFCVSAKIDLIALFPEKNTGGLSGTSMRLGQMKTNECVRGFQLSMRQGIQQVYSIATKLANARGVKLDSDDKPQVLEPEQIKIVYSDGLPTDREMLVREMVDLKLAGLTTLEGALGVLWRLSPRDAEEMAGKIREQKLSAPGTPPSLQPRQGFDQNMGASNNGQDPKRRADMSPEMMDDGTQA